MALIYVVSYFHRISPAVIAKELMASLAATGAQIGALSALYLYSFAVMQPAVGAVVDGWGARRAVTSGAVLMALGTFAFAFAATLEYAYLARLIIGIGASVVFIGTLKNIGNWFSADRFAIMSGLTQVAGNAGGLLAALPLAAIVAHAGWRSSFVLVGVLTVVLAALCWTLVRDYDVRAGSTRVVAQEVNINLRAGFAAVWGDSRTWLLFAIFFGIYGTLIAMSGLWGVPFLRDVYGLSAQEAAAHITTIALGVVVGSPLCGYISDKVLRRRRLPYAVFAFGYAGLWALLAFADGTGLSPTTRHLYCFLFGFSASGFMLTWACARDLNQLRYSGIATAGVNAGGFLGAALLQTIVGKILDAHWQGALIEGARGYPSDAYHVAFVFCFVFALLASLLILFLPETHCRNRGEW